MSAQTVQSQVQELESLRIARRPDPVTRTARRSTASKYLIVTFVAVALAITGYAASSHILDHPVAVQTVTVKANGGGGAGSLLTGSGYVVTRHKYITVGTKVLGQIVEEPVEEGQHVRKGQLLARIDDRDYRAELRQAIADRDLADANLRLNAAKLARSRQLFQQGYISREDLDNAENAAEVSQAAFQRDVAAIDYAKFMVSQCVIVSPISGIVLRKYREVGETVNYGGPVQAGGGATDIVQLADTGDMRAEVDVSEAEIAKVAVGMPATVVPDAYPDRHFAASVVKVYPEADRQKGTVKVGVRILQPDMDIVKPEMSVKVSFLERGSNAVGVAAVPQIVIPPKALMTGDRGKAYVWLVRDALARRQPIVPGAQLESGIVVRQGLNDGDILIVAPPADLKDGQKVRTASR